MKQESLENFLDREESEGYSTLPSGWRWVRLGEVCEFLDSKRIPVNDAERQKRIVGKKQSELYPYYGANGQVGWIDGYLFDEELVLLAEDGGFFGSLERPIAYRVSAKCWVNNHAHVLRAKRDMIDVDWLYFTLAIRPDIIEFVSGTTRPKLNQEQASLIPILLPPVSIQHRIAAKLQELMQEIYNLKSAIINQSEAAKALPSAYLRQVFESEEAKKWERKRLGEVCEKIIGGGTPSRRCPEYWGGSIYWLSPSELEEEKLNYVSQTKEKITEEGSNNSNAKIVPPKSVLLSCTASVGKVAISEVPLTTNQQFNSFVLKNTMAIPDFVAYYLIYRKDDIKQLGGKTTFTFISKDEIADLLLLLPSLKEQKLIASELKEKMAQVENLQSKIYNQQSAIDALPQAILRKAFRGEL
jgi:type I restriction enzyme S subunit